MTAHDRTEPVRLVPETGVAVVDGVLQATSLPVWLGVQPVQALARHAWIRIRYSSGLFDEAVRPLIRFGLADGSVVRLALNGAILGSAEWVGRVPEKTVSVSISPTRRLGPFSFRIDSIEPVSLLQLLRTALPRDPGRVVWAFQEWLRSAKEEAWQDLAVARGGTRFADYRQWRDRLVRKPDFAQFDRPRTDWARGPTFQFLMPLQACPPEALRATMRSLRAQVYGRWLLHAIADPSTPADVLSCYGEEQREDGRFGAVISEGPASAMPVLADGDWAAVIDAGDVLEDYALGAMAEAVAGDARLDLIYSDEDRIGQGGLLQDPMLKPDWSPVFEAGRPYLGRLTAVKGAVLASRGHTAASLIADEHRVMGELVTDVKRGAVGHIRRILCHRGEASPAVVARPAARASAPPAAWPQVSIVIPTRDRAELLSECLRSLEAVTDYPAYDVVVIDNGSTQADARALLDGLKQKPRYQVLPRPGPFNYALLCNDGARQTQAPVIVFLNNDITFFEPQWLKAMVRWALRPEIGFVGAKLLFPDRRIQHAGVVLGMGGLAGHVYLRRGAAEPGYLEQLRQVREVSAVTAACVAVERAKFDKVGGFDSEKLAVDLNDIDLCLRLGEAGFTNLWTPEAAAIHVQSASRGDGGDAFRRYQGERSYFSERWAEAMRDDPYFHPAFSLFSHAPELG